jgi:nucleotide-binding universal stress UspA family protein
MITIRRILCPVDFSRVAHHAFEQAVALAGEFNAELTVLHASAVAPVTSLAPMGAPLALEPARLTREEREAVTRQVHEFTDDLEPGGPPIVISVKEQDAVAAILATADALPADLIVMGTHGRSGFERLLLGSVTEKVLRKAICPVLTVPRRVLGARHSLAFGKILCAIDFSPASLRALDYAVSLAAPGGAGVQALNVVELFAEGGGMRDEIALDTPDFRAELTRYAQQRLHEAIPDHLRGLCPISESVSMGKGYREILRIAATEKCDLIVLGVQGRNAADLLLFGSTTQHVVRQAECPVLTIRAAN